MTKREFVERLEPVGPVVAYPAIQTYRCLCGWVGSTPLRHYEVTHVAHG